MTDPKISQGILNASARHLALEVWWIPQIPGEPFLVPVDSLDEARLVMDVLAEYDKFQYEHKIKPDYANAGGVRVWNLDEDGTWVDLDLDEEDEVDRYTAALAAKNQAAAEAADVIQAANRKTLLTEIREARLQADIAEQAEGIVRAERRGSCVVCDGDYFQGDKIYETPTGEFAHARHRERTTPQPFGGPGGCRG